LLKSISMYGTIPTLSAVYLGKTDDRARREILL